MAIDITAPGADDAALKAALSDLGMPVLVAEASASSGIISVSGLDLSDYSMVELVLSELTVQTNNTKLRMQWESGGAFLTSGYSWLNWAQHGGTTTQSTAQSASEGTTFIGVAHLATGSGEFLGNASGKALGGRFEMFHPGSTTLRKGISGASTFARSTDSAITRALMLGGHDTDVGAVTGFKFLMNTDNITGGVLKVYGRK